MVGWQLWSFGQKLQVPWDVCCDMTMSQQAAAWLPEGHYNGWQLGMLFRIIHVLHSAVERGLHVQKCTATYSRTDHMAALNTVAAQWLHTAPCVHASMLHHALLVVIGHSQIQDLKHENTTS